MTTEPSLQNDREPPPRLRDRVMKAGGWVTAGFVLDKVIAAVQLAILARLLTPADFGLVAASAVVLLTLLTLSEVGLEPALVTRDEVGERDLAVAWTLSLARGTVLACAVWLLADFVAAFFRTPELKYLLRVHAVVLIIQGVQSPALALLLRNLDLKRRVQLDLTRRVIDAGATIALAVWLRSVWALLLGQILGQIVSSALSYRLAPFHPRFSLHRTTLGYFFRYGKHLNLTSILILGVMSGGEIVIGRVLGMDALGFYQIALTIPALIGARAAYVMKHVSFPTYAILKTDPRGTVRAFAFQTGLVGLVLIPVAVGVALAAPDLVRIVFGPQWLGAVEPLQILCVYAVCAGLSGMMASLHYGLDRPELQTRIWAFQFLLYGSLILPLTYRFGLPGAACSLALSSILGLVLHVRYTVGLIGTEAWTVFGTLTRVVVVIAVLAGMLSLVINLPAIPEHAVVPMIGILIGIVLYSLYLWRIEYPRLAELWKNR